MIVNGAEQEYSLVKVKHDRARPVWSLKLDWLCARTAAEWIIVRSQILCRLQKSFGWDCKPRSLVCIRMQKDHIRASQFHWKIPCSLRSLSSRPWPSVRTHEFGLRWIVHWVGLYGNTNNPVGTRSVKCLQNVEVGWFFCIMMSMTLDVTAVSHAGLSQWLTPSNGPQRNKPPRPAERQFQSAGVALSQCRVSGLGGILHHYYIYKPRCDWGALLWHIILRCVMLPALHFSVIIISVVPANSRTKAGCENFEITGNIHGL